jgi:PilZ domain
MVSRQKKIGDSWASERFAFQCFIILASGMQVGEGRTLNMSECGCLAESSLPVKVGDNLQLRLSFQESEPSMRVSRATVCWVRGLRFGIEFIGIENKDRVRLNRYITLLGGDPWARTYD